MTIRFIPALMTLTDLQASNEFFRCFDDNIMKINPGKCHLLVSTNDNVAIRIGNFQIENTKREKLLRIPLTTSCLSIIIHHKYAKENSRKLYALVRSFSI